ATWREERARKRDRPRSWILKDAALFSLAQTLVQNRAELAATPEVSENFVRHEGEAVLQLLRQAATADEAECPPRQPAPLSPAQKTTLKRLQDAVETRAAELGIPAEILGRKRVLVPLLQNAAALAPGETLAPEQIPEELRGWRAHEILPRLREVLAS
ncbi:MAG: HRDC domain-containing protein, partial [Pseudohongiellaceae bacterium]